MSRCPKLHGYAIADLGIRVDLLHFMEHFDKFDINFSYQKTSKSMYYLHFVEQIDRFDTKINLAPLEIIRKLRSSALRASEKYKYEYLPKGE